MSSAHRPQSTSLSDGQPLSQFGPTFQSSLVCACKFLVRSDLNCKVDQSWIRSSSGDYQWPTLSCLASCQYQFG